MRCLTRLWLAAAAPLRALSVNRLIGQQLRSDVSAARDYDRLLLSQLHHDCTWQCRDRQKSLRQRQGRRRRRTLSKRSAAHTQTATPDTPSPSSAMPSSLATFYPVLSQTWLAAASSKMLQPHHLLPTSRKLAWWRCPHCGHDFTRRVDLHVACGGLCPACKRKPSLLTAAGGRCASRSETSRAPAAPPTQLDSRATSSWPVSRTCDKRRRQKRQTRSAPCATPRTGSAMNAAAPSPRASCPALGYHAEIVHRCRPDNSRVSLAAANAKHVRKSVADGRYLRVSERRNFMPMLAKNYEKESERIDESEVVWVSPKLDGVRCIAAYDSTKAAILFFSRSGTLFECCDAKIEPALQCVFERDPTLVLDGELYNDSTNQIQLAGLSAPLRQHPLLREIASSSLSSAAAAVHGRRAQRGGASTEDGSDGPHPCIGFDQLMSAVRTSREHCTDDVRRLQSSLQYHIFDVLYGAVSCSKSHSNSTESKSKRKGAEAVCAVGSAELDTSAQSLGDLSYARRYAHLTTLLRHAQRYNIAHVADYDPDVLRLVPAMACRKRDVAQALHAAMAAGYEGIMIRRGERLSTVQRAAPEGMARVSSSRLSARDQQGGYAYGERSSNLLKYKVMQDDEFIIVSAVQGNGKWTGCLGAFVCRAKNRQQQTFTVSPACTDEERRKMWSTWKTAYKGKALTVQYQSLTADGVPRFPVGKCVRGAASGKDWI